LYFTFTILPNVFRCLSKLEYLGAGENNLTSLPAEIGKIILNHMNIVLKERFPKAKLINIVD
jgi:hypothetical protein